MALFYFASKAAKITVKRQYLIPSSFLYKQDQNIHRKNKSQSQHERIGGIHGVILWKTYLILYFLCL